MEWKSVLVGLMFLLLTVGCAPARKPAGPVTREPSTGALSIHDPCAANLQEMCGRFLVYYQKEHDLPPDLETLKAIPFGDPISLSCPESGAAYIYNPRGILRTTKVRDTSGIERQKNDYVIVYDARAAHAGLRWAIVIEEPDVNRPLVIHVVPIQDSFFMWQK